MEASTNQEQNDTAAELATALFAVNRALRNLSADHPPARTLPHHTLSMLVVIEDMGEVRVSTIARRMSVDLSVISRQAKTLVEEGLLERQPDPDDRRAFLVKLSVNGQAALHKARAHYGKLVKSIVSDWSDGEIATLTEGMLRFVSAAKIVEEENPPRKETPGSYLSGGDKRRNRRKGGW